MPRPVRQRERIVSLAPSVTSILFALGARSQVVGVSKWCKEVVDVGPLPRLGDCWHGDTSAILRIKPTLIIGSVPYKTEVVQQLLQAPATFVATNPRTIDDIYRDIRQLGALVGLPRKAAVLIDRIRGQLDSIARQAHRFSLRPRVYSESWPNPHITSPPWVSELITIAGGVPVLPPAKQVSKAGIVRARPDVFIIAWAATGSRPRASRVLSDPAFQQLPAVRNKLVYVVRDEILNTPGPPIVAGARELFHLFHALAGKQPG